VISIELNNPSAWHALRIATQTRARNVVDKAPPAAPAPKRYTRAELEKIGSELVMVPSRGTAIVNGAPQSVTRDVPTPFYKTAGYDSLADFLTDRLEKGLRESQQAVPVAPRGERVVDTWGAPQPKLSVPPGGKVFIQLEEHTRLAVSCDEEVTLQIANTSASRTLRLRTLDTASGETAHCAWIPPAKEYSSAAIVTANGKQAAVIELQPS
jgi:hypothetical protein